jgi:hypothetical protein
MVSDFMTHLTPYLTNYLTHLTDNLSNHIGKSSAKLPNIAKSRDTTMAGR